MKGKTEWFGSDEWTFGPKAMEVKAEIEEKIKIAEQGKKKIGVPEFDSYLNFNYHFDNFVEGDCNRLPRTAGINIASQPGKTIFNPLFIYGKSGVGKTHLANAIGLKTKELHPPNKNRI